MSEEFCDCNRPNDIGRNNPCFDCGKPIQKCGSIFEVDYKTKYMCIKKRGHDGLHYTEIQWE
jgi:hypothetical protein